MADEEVKMDREASPSKNPAWSSGSKSSERRASNEAKDIDEEAPIGRCHVYNMYNYDQLYE